jgi:serine/threonine protein kinase/regulation of enolase protein 1 (concanavalin A-like superfamily)
MNEESIFTAALQIGSPTERAAYLSQACAGDVQLRQSVEALLEASAGAEKKEFLSGHPGAAPTIVTTRADGDTHDSSDSSLAMPFLDPCDSPNRLGKLGHYEVIELVGRGGMGSVLRAFDTKLVRIVAVKVMAPELAANPTAVKRFIREAQTAAAVHHDHVVTIHAIEEKHRPPYLVMQFVEGQTLQQKIDREGALDLARILRIGCQTAAGLAAAHKHGLIHRDVKPGNILLENGVERVKITDFGLARAADDVEMTQTGMIAGTPQYMSPEQAMGESIDARSDLFSLGSVLYAMCTGRPAFRAETTMGVLKRVCEDSPRPISEVNPSLPPWLSAIVAKLMAKNPADRFQSASEVAELLERHLAHLQNPAMAPRPETVFVPQARAFVPTIGKPPQVMPPLVGPLPARRWSTSGVIAITIALCIVACGSLPLAIGLFAYLTGGSREFATAVAVDEAYAQPVQAPLVDLRQWGEFVDPTGDCELRREERRVQMVLPGDDYFNLTPLGENGMNAPRLMKSLEGDFALQCRVSDFERATVAMAKGGANAATWRSAGLIVAIDDRSFVRLERVSWAERLAGAPRVHAEWFANGKKLGDLYENLPLRVAQPTWLRIEKRDAQLTLHFSDDGVSFRRWAVIANMAFPKLVQVGLAAVHTTNAGFEPWFDEVRLQSAPQADIAGGRLPAYRVPGWGNAWMADSKSIVRHDSTRIEPLPTGSLESFNLATGASQSIARRGKDPYCSPVIGGPIAYVIETTGSNTAVWLCDADGANPRIVSDGYYVAGWSPDGSRLYDYDWRKNRLRAIDWNNPGVMPETLYQFDAPIGSYPAVSRDGKRVAYQSKQGNRVSLVVCDIATRAIVRKFDVDAEFLLPGWSPAGDRVAFGSALGNRREFWMFDMASGEGRRLLEGHFTFPRWSPDGQWIAIDARDLVEVWIYRAADLDPWLEETPAPDAAAEEEGE